MGATASYPQGLTHSVPNWIVIVIQFSDWPERLNMCYLNNNYGQHFQSDYIYHIFCQALQSESQIFVPVTLPSQFTWKSLFKRLFPLRNVLWSQPSEDVELPLTASTTQLQIGSSKHKINVYSRFKPVQLKKKKLSDDATAFPTTTASSSSSPPLVDGNKRGETRSLRLPLHQRLAMIKLSNGLSSNRDAIRVLQHEGSWFAMGAHENKYTESLQIGTSSESSSYRQQGEELRAGVHSMDPVTGKVVVITADVGLREFEFNAVFPPSSSQKEVHFVVTSQLLMDFINGFNATVLVYGQTGAGKTHTMFGDHHDGDGILASSILSRHAGIVPRLLTDLLHATQQREEYGLISSSISMSYVEIFGEHVIDLLRGGIRCGHSKVAAQRFIF